MPDSPLNIVGYKYLTFIDHNMARILFEFTFLPLYLSTDVHTHGLCPLLPFVFLYSFMLRHKEFSSSVYFERFNIVNLLGDIRSFDFEC